MPIYDFFLAEPTAFNIACGILGLIIGSFLNVVIYRLPVMMERDWKQQCEEFLADSDNTTCPNPSQERFDLLLPRSRCSSCHQAIAAWDNIPVLSYAFLGGKCRNCKAPVSLRYPFVELLTAAASAAVAVHFGFTLQALFALIFTWALIALIFIDYDTQLLPDDITLPMLWLGLILSLFSIFVDAQTSIIGAVAGYLSLWMVYQLFKLATGKEGMGFGDFKLLALIGAWLGWQMLPVVILLSSVVGAIVGISLVLFRKHNKDHPIPFGPYLAAAGWIALLYGEEIVDQYLTLTI